MDSFFFLRHGETDANQQGLMCGGQWDIPINEHGRHQIQKTNDLIREKGFHFSMIWVSPMIRTQQTAEIVLSASPRPLTALEELREWNMGDWDRRPFTEVKDQFLGQGEPQGGETRLAFQARIDKALATIQRGLLPPLIVSHGGVWMVLTALLGLPRERLDNGVLKLLTRSTDGKWQTT